VLPIQQVLADDGQVQMQLQPPRQVGRRLDQELVLRSVALPVPPLGSALPGLRESFFFRKVWPPRSRIRSLTWYAVASSTP
jgi:hypothetical protein